MADPFTIAAVGMGAGAAGSAVSAFGSIFSGNAQANMYNYQSGIAAMNANIARQNADYSIWTGEISAQQSGLRTQARVAETKATQGAGNLDVRSGSNRAVQESEQEIGQYEQAIIRSDAARRAYGYRVEAASQDAQGSMYRASASTSRTSGYIGAITSILGGASSLSSRYIGGRTAGIFA